MPLNSICIELNRPRAIYHQGEHLAGKLLVESKYGLRHDGLLLSLEGHVDVTTNFRTLNLLDTFTGTNRTIPLIDFTYELLPAGRLEPGLTEVPFKMQLDESVDAPILYETYHGVFISIQYFLKCRIKRSIFYKDLIESVEFTIEYDGEPIGAPPLIKHPIMFEITPDSLTSSAPRRELIPNFKITGQLDSEIWRLSEPLMGEFVVEFCDSIIRSVELQLVRVETYGSFCDTSSATMSAATNSIAPRAWPVDDKYLSRDATEIQNIQIGDGDIPRQMPISIHMVLPRLFTCPTLITNNFKIGESISFWRMYRASTNTGLIFLHQSIERIGAYQQ